MKPQYTGGETEAQSGCVVGLKHAASIPSPSFPDGAGQRGLTRPRRWRRGPRAPAPRADHSSTRLPGPGCCLLARSVSVGCERLVASGVVFVRSDVWGGDRSSWEGLPDDSFVFASRTSLGWHSPGDGSPLAGPQMPLPSRLPARSGSVLLARRVEEQRGRLPSRAAAFHGPRQRFPTACYPALPVWPQGR